MIENSFFKVNEGSLTHRTLSEIDYANTTIVRALDQAEQYSNTFIPVQITLDGALRAISLLPSYPKWDAKGRVKQETIKEVIMSNFAALAHLLMADTRLTFFILPVVENSNSPLQFVPQKELILAMSSVAQNIRGLHLNKDVLAKISDGKIQTTPTSYGNLFAPPYSSGQVYRSDLRRIYGTWIIKLKPTKPNIEDDFVPGDCTRISVKELILLRHKTYS